MISEHSVTPQELGWLCTDSLGERAGTAGIKSGIHDEQGESTKGGRRLTVNGKGQRTESGGEDRWQSQSSRIKLQRQ